MGSDALVLGFDTSAAHCAAALLSGDRVLSVRAEEMGRGQAERLMPLLEEVLGEGGVAWRDLSRIGTGVGPGNFTGIRIAVSAARGLALAMDIPAIGISTFDAVRLATDGGGIPAVPAPRDQVYIRPDGSEPRLVPVEEAQRLGRLAYPPEPGPLALAIARAAAAADVPAPAPAPLYIRPADAAPPREAPPLILDDDA
ncbi:MAG: tRNA (adenosine(37)-N6)-threonylcarbamoyltransferase complex dimerization subunit type 1 TsaB [Roseovarius sp.]|uniref:tRNA (adenosine(37)-N6)-threonylcarbamoyltransferase complex dimerization subunit type 1 TsaB n=1 Tax=Roseovarius sp. TaxID=1486281 RepID=UPI0032EF9ACB